MENLKPEWKWMHGIGWTVKVPGEDVWLSYSKLCEMFPGFADLVTPLTPDRLD